MLRSFIFGLVACVGVNFMATATYAQECKSRARTEPSISASVDDENPSKDLTIDFDHFAIGKVPQNFIPLLLGKGKAVDWEIRSEPTARSSPNVLAEISTEEKQFRFPLLLHDKFSAKNVEVSVHFKPISGKIDQAAGVVARYQDEKRFYVIQASAIENEVKLYKVVDETQQVINGASAQVTSGKWHEILLRINDTHFYICFDGMPLFEAEDDTYQNAGKIGLATKSDGVTIFDDLCIFNMGEE